MCETKELNVVCESKEPNVVCETKELNVVCETKEPNVVFTETKEPNVVFTETKELNENRELPCLERIEEISPFPSVSSARGRKRRSCRAKFPCSLCPQHFCSVSQLNRHYQIGHFNGKPRNQCRVNKTSPIVTPALPGLKYGRDQGVGIPHIEEEALRGGVTKKKQNNLGFRPNQGTPPPPPTLGLPEAKKNFGLQINLKSHSKHFW